MKNGGKNKSVEFIILVSVYIYIYIYSAQCLQCINRQEVSLSFCLSVCLSYTYKSTW